MAKYVRFELDEDIAYIQGMFDRAIAKMKADPNAFDIEKAEVIMRVHDALHSPADVTDAHAMGIPAEVIKADTPEPKARKPRAKKGEGGRFKHNLCKDHPYYAAARVPRIECKGCWAAYKKMHPEDYTRKRRDFTRKLKQQQA